jgi:hypothetical protein
MERMSCRLFAIVAVGLCAMPVQAVIQRPVSLKEVLAAEQLIFVGTISELDERQRSMVVEVTADLKGSMKPRRLQVRLEGDAEAQKTNQARQLMERLSLRQELVVFASMRGRRTTFFVFANGTWFQLIGEKKEDSEAIALAFTHFEPYLRRTFKGTTAEMKEIVADGLAGKREPPAINVAEPPGIGPPVKK